MQKIALCWPKAAPNAVAQGTYLFRRCADRRVPAKDAWGTKKL